MARLSFKQLAISSIEKGTESGAKKSKIIEAGVCRAGAFGRPEG